MHLRDFAAHYIPFAALMAAAPPPNRPALTRLSEQLTVALIAAVTALQYNAHEEEKRLAVFMASVTEWQHITQRTIETQQAMIEQLRRDLYAPRATK